MKRSLPLFFLVGLHLLLMGTTSVFALDYTEGSRSISKLWKEYDVLESQDLPKSQIKCLHRVISLCEEECLPWNFYKAVGLLEVVENNLNWKNRDSVRTYISGLVQDFDEPVVSFLWTRRTGGNANAREFLMQNVGRLQTAANRLFYEGTLGSFYRNDYEYALWTLYESGDNEVTELIKDYSSGYYPLEPYLEYLSLDGDDATALEAFARRYADRAIGLYAEADLMLKDFYGLSGKGTGEDYRALYGRCRAFEKRRNSYKGDEKIIASAELRIRNLIASLSSSATDLSVRDSVITVRLRNLSGVKLTITADGSSKTLWKKTLKNYTKSFYCEDTLKVALPALGDGSYRLKAVKGKVQQEIRFSSYRISAAVTHDSRGWCLYAADYFTGRPLEKVDLRVSSYDKGELLVYKDFTIDGFTPLPKEILDLRTQTPWIQIECRHTTSEGQFRSSQELNVDLSQGSVTRKDQENVPYVALFTDKGAYNPGETLYFKGIASQSGNYTVQLTDSEGKSVADGSVRTNGFGSFSGQFAIPSDRRNGFYRLSVLSGVSDCLASRSVRVDSFTLPTFDVTLSTEDKLYRPGDEVVVKAVAKSYSGHDVSTGSIVYRVICRGKTLESGKIISQKDGKFEVRFNALTFERYCALFGVKADAAARRRFVRYGLYYQVEVQVSDLNGETLSFDRTICVRDRVDVSAQVLNAAQAQLEQDWLVMTGDAVQLDLNVCTPDGLSLAGEKMELTVKDASGVTVGQRSAVSGCKEILDLSQCETGLYHITVRAHSDSTGVDVLLLRQGTVTAGAEVHNLIMPDYDSPGINVLWANSSDLGLWAVAQLYAPSGQFLDSRVVTLSEDDAREGVLKRITFEYKDSYPDEVRAQVFYFVKGKTVNYGMNFKRRDVSKEVFPLELDALEDRTLPATTYTYTIKTRPGAECLVSIFDKSSETVNPNVWATFNLHRSPSFDVDVDWQTGFVGSADRFYHLTGASLLMKNSASVLDYASAESFALTESEGGVQVRENFATTLAFLPHLVADSDGKVKFSFTTSDKLSTYVVALFAHDKNLNNAAARSEIQVTIPIKVSMNPPSYLYQGDECKLPVSVSSISGQAVSGKLALYKGSVKVGEYKIIVPARRAVSKVFSFSADEIGSQEITAVFVSDSSFSDAVRVRVDVRSRDQEITEAHSAVWRPGTDKDLLIGSLKEKFVNASGQNAVVSERNIREMIGDLLAEKVSVEGTDALSLSDALYARLVLNSVYGTSHDTDSLRAILAKCINADGGVAWYAGMPSSPAVSAVVLERNAYLRTRGEAFLGEDVVRKAVEYLDTECLKGGDGLLIYRGGLSRSQYLYVRSLYAEVPFDAPKGVNMKDFCENAFAGTGYVLATVRKASTLLNLSESEAGRALARKWGIGQLTYELESVMEYAVDYPGGGKYYPNAVGQFGALMESDAYAHSLICSLLRRSGDSRAMALADSVSLYLMLQKETQQWHLNAHFVDVVNSILASGEEVLGTEVIALSQTFTKPIEKIASTGNGFTIKANWSVQKTNGKYRTLREGETLRVGDRVKVEYCLYSQDNRSFVKVSAPRAACLRPVDQLSGVVYAAGSSAYRDVRGDRTEYMILAFPQEKSSITEEFFVERSGFFSAPVLTVESLYAPHYRANSAPATVMVAPLR